MMNVMKWIIIRFYVNGEFKALWFLWGVECCWCYFLRCLWIDDFDDDLLIVLM